MRRFRDDAARVEHMHSDVIQSFSTRVVNELQIVKQAQLSNYVEHDALGWACRDHEHEEDAMRSSSAVHNAEHGTESESKTSADSTASSSSSSKSSSQRSPRVTHVITGTSYPGKRMEVLSHVQRMTEECREKHTGIYTWLAFLSESNPDRHVALKRFRDAAACAEHMAAPEVQAALDRFTHADPKIYKQIQLENMTEFEEFGWTCREHMHMTGSIDKQAEKENVNINSNNKSGYGGIEHEMKESDEKAV